MAHHPTLPISDGQKPAFLYAFREQVALGLRSMVLHVQHRSTVIFRDYLAQQPARVNRGWRQLCEPLLSNPQR